MTGAGVTIYDTTLRDGMQQEGMSVSVDEKVRIALRARRARAALHRGRLSGLEPQGDRLLRAHGAREAAARRARGLRHDAPQGRGRRRRPRPAGAGRRLDSGRDHRRQDLGPAPAHRAAREPRREPAHDRRVGRVPRGAGQARDLRRRALLRRLGRRRRSTRCARCASPPRRAPSWSVCATPTAARCRPPSRAWSPRSRASSTRRSACTATTTPTAPWPTRSWRWPPGPSRCRAP